MWRWLPARSTPRPASAGPRPGRTARTGPGSPTSGRTRLTATPAACAERSTTSPPTGQWSTALGAAPPVERPAPCGGGAWRSRTACRFSVRVIGDSLPRPLPLRLASHRRARRRRPCPRPALRPRSSGLRTRRSGARVLGQPADLEARQERRSAASGANTLWWRTSFSRTSKSRTLGAARSATPARRTTSAMCGVSGGGSMRGSTACSSTVKSSPSNGARSSAPT
jgi:hypothetical protein